MKSTKIDVIKKSYQKFKKKKKRKKKAEHYGLLL
jgi:hypothetical protein